MVLEKLSSSLRSTIEKIAGSVFIDDAVINELVKDIQRALLQADVNVKLVFELTTRIKERSLKEKPGPGLTKKEQVINIVYDELAALLGGEGSKIHVNKKPFKIMLVGLFGSGKTTTSAKLAKFFQKRAMRIALIQLDVWRPAAYEQMKQLSEKINIPVFGDQQEKDPVKLYERHKAELEKFDIVIIDTAGRDALSHDLIEELNSINQKAKPDETLLVLSADIGQTALKQAQAFHDTVDVSGVIITKLDGTAKGGGALIACSVTGSPVKFIGTGEKINELEEFNPKGFVSRLLGMGDIEALLEKAKDAITKEQAEDLEKKLLKGEFNLIDLYEQMLAMKKMGPLSKVMDLFPGFSQIKMPKDVLDVQQEKLEQWRYIMDSMNKDELEEPNKLSKSRVERIAKGSGSSVSDVRGLIKQYRQSKKLLKMFKGGKNMEKMMKRLGMG